MLVNLNKWRPQVVLAFIFMTVHIHHNDDVAMGAMASQITSLTIVYSTVYSGADQRKYQCSASLAFVRGIHRWPMNSPHKGPETRLKFPFDDVIMRYKNPLYHDTLYNTVELVIWSFMFNSDKTKSIKMKFA